VSTALYATVLRWGNRGGVAKLHGKSVHLDSAPHLCDGQVHALDYIPEIGLHRIQRRAIDPADDMTPDEVRAADALLAHLVRDVAP
jgi:hypothetical protein